MNRVTANEENHPFADLAGAGYLGHKIVRAGSMYSGDRGVTLPRSVGRWRRVPVDGARGRPVCQAGNVGKWTCVDSTACWGHVAAYRGTISKLLGQE